MRPRNGSELEWILADAVQNVPDTFVPTTWGGHIPFLFALFKIDRPRTFVELGVRRGGSFLAACSAAQRFETETACYGVDTWTDDGAACDGAGNRDGDAVYGDLSATVTSRYPLARLLRGTFAGQVDRFPEQSIDLLHIDGVHAYTAAKETFAVWLPKLSSRAIVLIHDINVREEGFGVWRLWAELAQTYPSMTLHHSFGLGVAFVGADLQPLTRKLLETWQSNAAFRALFESMCDQMGGSLPRRYHARENVHLAVADADKDKTITSLKAALTDAKALNAFHRKYATTRTGPWWRPGNHAIADVARRLSNHPAFDSAWYTSRYTDLAVGGMDPALHYVLHGFAEGRFPHPLFDTRWYLSRYPDVLASGVNPLVHYIEVAARGTHDPNRFLNTRWYLDTYPDVAAASIDPMLHFQQHGLSELRDPGPTFSTARYVASRSAQSMNLLLYQMHFQTA